MGLVLPFSIWMMKGFCDTVDRDLEDAAFIEGATSLSVIWSIVVPLIGPGIAAVSIFCFLASWNHMLYVLLLATDNSTITVPYGIMTSYAGVFQYTYGLLAAGIVFTTAPIVLLFLWRSPTWREWAGFWPRTGGPTSGRHSSPRRSPVTCRDTRPTPAPAPRC